MSENKSTQGVKQKKQVSSFQELFMNEINPKVKPLEAQRKKMVQTAYIIAFVLFIAGCVFDFIYCKYFANNHYNLNIMIGAFIPIVVAVFLMGKKYKNKIRAIVLPQILSYAGDFKIGVKPTLKSTLNKFLSSDKKEKVNLDYNGGADNLLRMISYFTKLNLFSEFNFAYINEHIIGKYKGIDLNIYETELWYSDILPSSKNKMRHSSDKNKNVNMPQKKYNGVVFNFKCPKTITTQTLVLKNNQFPVYNRDKLQKVKLEDPLFEKYYDVYSGDQIESRTLLTPAFINRIVTLYNEKNEVGINMSVSFMDGYVNIAVASKKSWFDVPFFKPVTHYENYKVIIKNFMTILSIIDTLKYSAE